MQVEDPEESRGSAEERQLRRMNNTPQGGATEGNAALRLRSGPWARRTADDTLMVDQAPERARW